MASTRSDPSQKACKIISAEPVQAHLFLSMRYSLLLLVLLVTGSGYGQSAVQLLMLSPQSPVTDGETTLVFLNDDGSSNDDILGVPITDYERGLDSLDDQTNAQNASSDSRKSHTLANVSAPGYISLGLRLIESSYFADLHLGSSNQSVTLQLDTASSDLWVMGNGVNCLEPSRNCTGFGAFNVFDSSTYRPNRNGPYYYNVGVQPWYTIGKWGSDSVSFSNISVDDVTFAVASTSDNRYGVLGIGSASAESTNLNDEFEYDNFPLLLVSQGLINRNVYSIYLDSADCGNGSVLFGAVDHAKYSGQLQTVPFINAATDINDFTIVLRSITMSLPSSSVYSLAYRRWPAVLDTTLNITQFPQDMADSLLSSPQYQQTASNVSQAGGDVLNASFLTFNFSGVAIQVPLSEFVLPSLGPNQLNFAILKSQSNTIFIGADVLRYMYRVYDLDRHELSIAQARHVHEEDVHVVVDDIPNALQAATYSSTLVGYAPLLPTGDITRYGAAPALMAQSQGWLVHMIAFVGGLVFL